MDTFSSLGSISLDNLDTSNTSSPSSSHPIFCHSDGDSCSIPAEYEHSSSAGTGWYCIIA
ncbi:hypothetical protein M405DRAFT_818233 [Rhizopogon salebrosus TDB-379]|nr:hypothetical protein M405DRAFT_818233 [Rhizopogon salebrosus TDB-379]